MSGTPKANGAWRDHAYSASALRKIDSRRSNTSCQIFPKEGFGLVAE